MKLKHKIVLILFGILVCLGFTFSVHADDSVLCEAGSLYIGTSEDKTETDITTEKSVEPTNQKSSELSDLGETTQPNNEIVENIVKEEVRETQEIVSESSSFEGKSTEKVELSEETTEVSEQKTNKKIEANSQKDVSEEVDTENTGGEKFEHPNYTVEFHYNNLTHTMQGGESTKLSTVLQKLKISGNNIEKVKCSDESLFSVSNDGGEWIINSIKPFSSTESLKVTVDGKIYDVTVTDEATSGYVGNSTTIIWELFDDHILQVWTANGVSSPQTMPNSSVYLSGNLFSGLTVSKVTRIRLYGYLGTIGNFAFCGMDNLTTVNWDTDKITSIGEHAFMHCIRLTNIPIYSSVTNIEREAFRECYGLTSITIPNSITNIGESAFYDCASLTSITIPSSVTNIGNTAFRGCYNMTSITISNSSVTIGNSAFYGCTSVSNVVIPTSVVSIGNMAFTSLASGANIWYNHAESMKSNAKSNLASKCYNGSIGNSFDSSANMYFKCGNQLWYTITNNVAIISKGNETAGSAMWDYSFSGSSPNFVCTSPFSSGNSAEGNTITAVNIYDATTIGAAAFFRCDNLTTVNIVNSVTSISTQAFNIDVNLQTVFIPSTVASIGASAFQNNNASYYCSNAISINDLSGKCSGGLGNVFSTSVGQSFYFRCGTNLWYMLSAVDGGTAYIVAYPSNAADKTMTNYSSSNSPFYALRSTLTGVNLGPATTVGDYAFIGCTGITTVTIPNTVTSLGTGAFQGSALSSVNFQANSQLTYLGPGAFLGTALTNVSNLPSSITTIGFYAFKDCTSLTRVVIPPNANINYDAFNGCSNLTDVIFQGTGVRPQSNAFRGMKSTAHIYWPDTSDASLQTACGGNIADKFAVSAVHNSGNNAYVFCFKCGPSLWYKIQDRTVIISKEIETGSGLLMYDSWNSSDALSPFNYYKHFFESLVISNDVANISKYAFYNCTGLTSVTIPSSITSVGENAFQGTINGANFFCKNAISKTDLGTKCKDGEGLAQDDIAYSFPNHENQHFFFQCGDNLWYELSTDTGGTATIVAYPTNAANKIMWNWVENDATHPTPSPFVQFGSNLTAIDFGDGTTVGSNAFNGCSGLTNITIPSSITSIGQNAFSSCSGLNTVVIPDSFRSGGTGTIGQNAFSSTPNGMDVYYMGNNSTEANLASGCYGGTIAESFPNEANQNFYYMTYTVDIGKVAGNLYAYFDSGYTQAVISGTGEMKDWTSSSGSPFNTNKNTLTALTITSGATTIGDYAFSSCSGLTGSLTIPNGVTLVGSCAFEYCSGLTSVTFLSTNTEIMDHAFSVCTDLEFVTLPSALTEIKEYTFSNCGSLTSIEIPDDVTSIDEGAFFACSNLTSVTFGTSVETIGFCAFEDCTALESIELPDSVTSIGVEAFYGCCDSLTSVVIPDSVTAIGESAFGYCGSLKTVVIPDTFRSGGTGTIGSWAFGETPDGMDVYYIGSNSTEANLASGCYGGTIEGSFPNEANQNFHYTTYMFDIGKVVGHLYAFFDSGYTQAEISGTGEMKDWTSSSGSPFNANSTTLTMLVFNDGATSIGSYTFNGCSGLTNITIPSSVASIGQNAFQGTTNGASFFCKNAISKTDLGTYCKNNEGEAQDDIAYSFPNHANQNFYFQCGDNLWYEISSNDTTVSIFAYPSGLPAADRCMFDTWSGSGSPFYSVCSTLTTINWGTATYTDTASTIGEYAFYQCVGLTSITISDSVTSIGASAFDSCSGLESVTIPDSVTYIGISAFDDCSNLTSLTIGSSVTNIGASAFNSCSSLTSVVIPGSVTSIGDYAFVGLHSGADIYYNNTASEKSDPAAALEGKCATSIEDSFGYTLDSTDEDHYIFHFKCGDHLYYTIDGGTTATIVTDGTTQSSYPMWSWTSGSTSPFTKSASTLTTVDLGSATTIGDYAFDGCLSLTGSLTIPSGVTFLGVAAFRQCRGLTGALIVPNLVTSISNQTFYGCRGLTGSLTIPGGVTSIGDSAFYGCIGFTEIIISSGVASISQNAFNGCSSVTTVTIPTTITNIYGNAFTGMASSAVVNYSGKQAAFEPKCATSVANCFGYAVGATGGYLFHFIQDITYYPGEGTMPTTTYPTSYETNSGNTITLPEPTRENYRFDGWYYDSSYTDPVGAVGITSFTANNTQFGDKTFYAKWGLLSRLIIYYCQYGAIATPTVTQYVPGSGETLTLDKPTRANYAFCGWHQDVTLTNTPVSGGVEGEKLVSAFNDDATLTFAVGSNDQDVAFYAEWYQCEAFTYWDSSLGSATSAGTNYEIVKECETIWGGDSSSNYVYVLKDDVTFTEPITVVGNVKLILKDNCSLDSSNIITVNDGEGTLTIYSEKSDAEYNAPVDESENPQMQFSKYTERTTKQSFTLGTTTYYLDEDTYTSSGSNAHYEGWVYDKTDGSRYFLHYEKVGSSVEKLMIPEENVLTNLVEQTDNQSRKYITYNGNNYYYDSTSSSYIYTDTDSQSHSLYTFNEKTDSSGNQISYGYIVDSPSQDVNMVKSASITINTASNWNANNPSFCYYTQDNKNYYENANHVLINETSGNTPTAYHLETDSQNAVTYSNSASRGKIDIDATNVSPLAAACIGGDEGNINGNITIHGGEINLSTDSNASCIGSGDCSDSVSYESNGNSITIYGGKITAINYSKTNDAAVIGGGHNSSGGTISISGGQIVVTNKSVTVGAGRANTGLTPTSSQHTSVSLNWTNKTDYIDSQCGGFANASTSAYTDVTTNSTNKYLYQRRGTATAATEGSGVLVSSTGANDNISTNNNFRIIPYFEVDYTLVYPPTGVVLPFKSGSAYAFGCTDAETNQKFIGISTQEDDPSTENIDETCTVVKPYCLALTTKAKVMKRVKNYTTVNGVRQAVFYEPEEQGYDSISFDIVEIASTDASGNVSAVGSSIDNVPILFVGDDYNYNSGRESSIDGVKGSIALMFRENNNKKSGIYQGSVSFIAGTGIIEDENVNEWYDYYNS